MRCGLNTLKNQNNHYGAIKVPPQTQKNHEESEEGRVTSCLCDFFTPPHQSDPFNVLLLTLVIASVRPARSPIPHQARVDRDAGALRAGGTAASTSSAPEQSGRTCSDSRASASPGRAGLRSPTRPSKPRRRKGTTPSADEWSRAVREEKPLGREGTGLVTGAPHPAILISRGCWQSMETFSISHSWGHYSTDFPAEGKDSARPPAIHTSLPTAK